MDQDPYQPPNIRSFAELTGRDFSPFIARYLFWLGVLNLIGLNLGGALWIWFAGKIRTHNAGFRWATLILCGIMMAAGLAVIALAMIQGAQDMSLLFLSNKVVKGPPVWLAFLLGTAIMLVHGIPFVLLFDRGTRSHFR